jgi:hypothetical protein
MMNSAVAATLAAPTPTRSEIVANRQYWVDSRNGKPASNSEAAAHAIGQAGANGSPSGLISQRDNGTAAAASAASSPTFNAIRKADRWVAMWAAIEGVRGQKKAAGILAAVKLWSDALMEGNQAQ